jgi:putative addiction module antidote
MSYNMLEPIMPDRSKGLSDTEAPAFDHAPVSGGATRLKVTQIGNSLGVILPKELLAKLNVAKGDVLIATDADGGFRVTVFDPEFDSQMDAARRIMKERRAVLRELAK